MKRSFDLAIITPLEEEFEAVLSYFEFRENLSASNQIRFAVGVADSDFDILIVKQNSMGRTQAETAALNCLSQFNANMLVCLGIAGGLSGDVSIGDVCHTGGVYDLLDNAKAADSPTGAPTLHFSPTYYPSPDEIAVALTVSRLDPKSKPEFQKWQSEQESFGRTKIPGEFPGKTTGKLEKIEKPSVFPGDIACAAVLPARRPLAAPREDGL